MPPILKDKIEVPNWLMGIIVSAMISVFALGWRSIGSLEDELIKVKESTKYRYEQIDEIRADLNLIEKRINNIDKKLDVLLIMTEKNK